MRIRAVDIKNWACIESLTLTDLHDGVVVLHGPNRTGKSSIVQALRSTLFDHFHDSQDRTLLDAVPWKTRATPHVAIEFEHGGQHFRIAKTFAKTREGQATLEARRAGDWFVLARGKDATKQVRDMLGVQSSEAGVFQMLWLGQRDFQLPEPRAIDRALAKALEGVLGTLITGIDLDFKTRIDAACERWFTPTMKDKKDSPVARLAADLADARSRLENVERQWNDAEERLREYEEALARQPELKRLCEESAVEMERLRKECEGVRQRKAQFELAEKNQEQCRRLLAQADQRRTTFDEDVCRLEFAGQMIAKLELDLQAATDARLQADQSAAQAVESLHQAEQRLESHQASRAELEDRRRLTTNQVECQSLTERKTQAAQWDQERVELEQKLAGPAVLSQERIRELRQMRERAAALRAKLEAAEIHVRIVAQAPVEVQIASDGAPAENVSLVAAQEHRRPIRQQAELQIGALASVTIGRAEEDRHLETFARELVEIEKTLDETLRAANLEPSDPTALDQLATQRNQHDQDAKRLGEVRDNIARAAPGGLPALDARLHQNRDERQAILSRRPELAEWSPDTVAIERLRLEFDECESRLKAGVQYGKKQLDALRQALRGAENAEQEIRTKAASQQAQMQDVRERVAKLDRAVLVQEVEEARARLTDAEARAQEAKLSESDLAMEVQFENARTAHKVRAERVRDNEDTLLRLQTQLAGAEGLHQKRILCEQSVHDRQRDFERESLYARAHKRLKELFENVRQVQVRRTVGPINDRVMQWAGQLGVGDYAALEFDGRVLPAALAPNQAPDAEAVALDRESYGTLEQLSLLIRLAVGGLLARSEPAVAILDDPLAHSDPGKHRKMLEILACACRGEPQGPHPTGPLQLIILTCHEDRFDSLDGAQQFDLARLIRRGR